MIRIAALCLLALTACSSKGDGAPATYTVKATVEKVDGTPTGEVHLAHEAIPDFKDKAGKTIGMEAMTMPFAYGEDVDVSGLKAGDEVKISFQMDWSKKPATRLTSIQKTTARRGRVKVKAE